MAAEKTEGEWGWARWRGDRTLEGEQFFGGSGTRGNWQDRSDYPLRFFLAETSRDAWEALQDPPNGLSEKAVLAVAGAIRHELDDFSKERYADLENEQINDDSEVPDVPAPLPLVCQWTHDLDADEIVMENLEDDWLTDFSSACGVDIDWDVVTFVFALHHVSNAVRLLNEKQTVKVGALAIKARDWYWWGKQGRLAATAKWIDRTERARGGADAAHAENRRVRLLAMEIYASRKWPSKMQAARVIAGKVHRTEMVVLRWIRELSKEGVTVRAQ